jgi:phage-related protein
VAIVGTAFVVVRALTDQVKRDIRSGFAAAEPVAEAEGRKIGQTLSDGVREGMKSGGGGGGKTLLDAILGSGFAREAKAANDAWVTLLDTGYALGPAIAVAVSAISSLVVSLGTLIAQLAAATPALFVFASGVSAVVQAAGVLKLAFAGVGAAISQGVKAAATGGGNAAAATAANARRVEDARRRLALAIEAAAEAEERANRRVIESFKDYQDAAMDVEKAIRDLAKARRQAAEDAQQLNFDAEEAALNEQEALYALQDARERLNAVKDLPPNERAYQEAQLALQQADLEYRRAVDRNKDLAAAQDEANAKGIDGADNVVSAADDVVNAKEREAEAYQNYQDAVVEAARAERDALRNIEDARRNLADALKAQADGARGAAGAASAYQQALDKLSPAARRFVKFIVGLRPEIDKLKAAAGVNLFPALESSIQKFVDNLFPRLIPLLQGTGKVLGEVAKRFADIFTGSAFLDGFERVWKSNDKLIANVGNTVANLAVAFFKLLDAISPVAEEFGAWIEKISGDWAKNLSVAQARDTFVEAARIAKILGATLKDLGKGFGSFYRAATGPGSGGDILINSLRDSAATFRDFMAKVEKSGELAAFLKGAATNAQALGKLFVRIVKVFGGLADNKGVAETADALGPAVDSLGKIADTLTSAGPALAGFITKVATLLQILTDSEAIKNFFAVLSAGAGFAIKVLSAPGAQQVLLFFSGILGALRGVGLLVKVLKFFGLAFAGIGIKALSAVKAFLGFRKALSGLRGNGFKGFFKGLVDGSVGVRKEFDKQMALEKMKKDGIAKLGKEAQTTGNSKFSALRRGSERVRGAFSKTIGSMKNFKGGLGGITKGAAGAARGLASAGKNGASKFGKSLKSGLGKSAGIFGLVLGGIATLATLGGKDIEGLATQIAAVIQKLPEIITQVLQQIPGLISKIAEALPGVLDSIVKALPAVIASLTTAIPQVLNAITAALPAIIGLLTTALPQIISALALAIPDVITALLKAIPLLITGVVKALPIIIKALIKAIPEIIKAIIKAVPDIISAIIDALPQIVTALIGAVVELAQALVDALGPLATDVWSWLTESLSNVWDNIVTFFTVTAPAFIKSLPGKFVAAGKKVWEFLLTGIKTYWNLVTGFYSTIFNFIKDLPARFIRGAGKIWEFLSTGIKTAWGAVKGYWDGTVWPFITGLPGKIGKAVSGVWDGFAKAFKDAVNSIIRLWNDLRLEIAFPDDLPLPFSFLSGKGFSLDTPNVPTLASGGTALATKGGTLVRVAEAGKNERIEPLDKDGLSKRDKAMIKLLAGEKPGGAVVVNVYPAPGMDERDLAAKVSREISKQMRVGGR